MMGLGNLRVWDYEGNIPVQNGSLRLRGAVG